MITFCGPVLNKTWKIMDNIVISQWRNSQWNGDLKSTMEEYSTSFNDSMSGDLLICPRYLILKMIGLIFGIFFVMIWPIIAWILLKLVGYAVIGLTLGDGYEFVNSTFFQWAEEKKMDIDFSIWFCTPGREGSKVVGCVIKIYFLMFF